MHRLKNLCLFLSVGLILGCAKDYRALVPISDQKNCYARNSIPYQEGWLTAHIDVVGKNLSGLIFIKALEDGSRRVVFTNEVGVTFFDFSFSSDGKFSVKQILPVLNKKAIIKTLRNDFSLFLGIPFNNVVRWEVSIDAEELYYKVPWDNGKAYYITSTDCRLQRLEYGSNKKRVVAISYPDPNEIVIEHFTFQMRIHMKKIDM
jgi:hypothetical protein